MGVKDGFMGASLFMKLALVLMLVANLFSWIAFTTTSWGYMDSGTEPGFGLWRRCADDLSGCSFMDGTRRDWFGAFQAFGIFGFAGLSVSLFLLVLIMFFQSWQGNGEAKMAAFILAIAGGLCWLIAVIIFAAEYNDNGDNKFGFSFALAIIAFIVSIIGGILIIVDSKSSGGSGTSPA